MIIPRRAAEGNGDRQPAPIHAARWIVPAALAVFVAAPEFPILLFPSYTVRIVALWTAGALGLAFLPVLLRARVRVARPAAALIFWIVLAAAFSGAFRIALVGTVGRELTGLIVISSIGLWALGRATNSCHIIHRVLISALVVNAIVGVVQVLLILENGPFALGFGRADGLTSNPVYFGALMAAGVGLAGAWGTVPPWARASLVGLFACAVNLSGSRVAAVAAVVAVIVAIAIPTQGSRYRRAIELGAGFGAGVVLSMAVLRAGSSGDGSISRVAQGGSGGRLDAWRYGVTAIWDRPLFGWGFGRFRAATQESFSADFVRSSASSDVTQAWFDAHNILINTAVSIGVVGLALAAWFVLRACHGMETTYVPFLIALSTTWMLQPVALATLPVAAIVLGVAGGGSAQTVNPEGAGRREWYQLAALVGFVVGSVGLLGDVLMQRAIDRSDTDALSGAARLFPADSVVADVVAQAQLLQAQFEPRRVELALEWSERALSREPDRPYYWRRHAERLLAAGRPVEAQEALETAIGLQPWHLESWELLLVVGQVEGDRELEALAVDRLCRLAQRSDACG